jgi:protein-tyrosine-phosphatase/predicted ATP-grasp superfamily ATP-dependent carboligase
MPVRPALIFNSIQPITVAVSRCLSKRGVPVTFADIGAPGRVPASRAIHNFVRLPDYQNTPDEFIAALTKLIQTGGYDTILPCSDGGLVAISRYYDRLAPLVYLGCPQPHIVRRVLDKNLTLEAARACDIPLPKTYQILNITALEQLRGEISFPVIAKPRSKVDERRHTFKTHYFATYQELRDAFLGNAQFGAENLLQEYCHGVGVGIEVLLHNGEPLTLFQHRRVKELPVSGGGSVLCISEPLNHMLAELAVTLLRAIEWQGVAMVEFRYDPKGGRAVLMEVNGRYWGSLPLAIAAGVNFPLYEWQLAHGEAPSVPRAYPVGLRARWLSADVHRLTSLFLEAPRDGFPRPSKWAEAARFLTDFVVPTRPYLWSWSDPLPALIEFKQAMRPIAATAYKQMAGKVRQSIGECRDLGARGVIARCTIGALYALRLKRDRPPLELAGVRSVLFVCHGNKIRSPMAEALFGKSLAISDCGAGVSISSAGLILKPEARADERARIVAKEFGVSLDDHRPRHLTAAMVKEANLIFIMDNLNEARMRVLYPGAMYKVFYLGAYNKPTRLRHNGQIDDPDRGTLADIRACYQILDDCIQQVTAAFRQKAAREDQRVALVATS